MRVPEAVLKAGITAQRPTYVYHLETLDARCARLERLPIPRKRMFFATMANDHPAVLSRLRDRGHGVFVNSQRHLRMALDLRFPGERIIYAASNMTIEEMTACRSAGVHVVLDSLGQIGDFGGVGGTEIGLRINVGSALDGTTFKVDPGYRFGVLAEELPAAVALAAQFGIRIVGIHCYFGTDLMDEKILLAGLNRLGSVGEMCPDLRYIDAGGGFGVCDDDRHPREFDIEAWGRGAAEIMARYERRLGRVLDLYIEPGRYIVAECGFFFVRVIDVKTRADRAYVGTNASVVQFPRPLLYPETAFHPLMVVGRPADELAHPLPVWVCGNSTYSRDFLARNRAMPLPRPGNILLFGNAGAYCRSMISEFLGKERPVDLVVGDAAVDAPTQHAGVHTPEPVYTGD